MIQWSIKSIKDKIRLFTREKGSLFRKMAAPKRVRNTKFTRIFGSQVLKTMKVKISKILAKEVTMKDINMDDYLMSCIISLHESV